MAKVGPNGEPRIIDVLKKLKKKKTISENIYEYLYPVGSCPGILYGRAKIHKPIKDGVPSFHPILSAIGTPTYKLYTIRIFCTISNTFNFK